LKINRNDRELKQISGKQNEFEKQS